MPILAFATRGMVGLRAKSKCGGLACDAMSRFGCLTATRRSLERRGRAHPEAFGSHLGLQRPRGLGPRLNSPLARSHNERPLSAANSATLLAMRAAHSMVPAATLRPDE